MKINHYQDETLDNAVKNHGLPREEPLGTLEPVTQFYDAMPTGVTVSHKGRVFVNFPKWGDDVPFTVAEIREGKALAYPDETTNQTNPNEPAAALVSVQSVVVDPSDRLWILDTGSPLFQPISYGGPKLVCVDLNSDKILKKILFTQDVALPTTYLNDVRFDLRRGNEGMAFITDSAQKGPNGIIAVDLRQGTVGVDLMIIPQQRQKRCRHFSQLLKGDRFYSGNQTGL
jgi:sugar lactone lactonase YvrE